MESRASLVEEGLNNKQTKEHAFELVMAENLKLETLKLEDRKKLENKRGLVVIEKSKSSPLVIKYHYVGDKGISNFIKLFDEGKV